MNFQDARQIISLFQATNGGLLGQNLTTWSVKINKIVGDGKKNPAHLK